MLIGYAQSSAILLYLSQCIISPATCAYRNGVLMEVVSRGGGGGGELPKEGVC
jgi:hypothetical protein